MEQSPGHGSYLVEELYSFGATRSIDGSGIHQELQKGIHLFGGCIGDSPVIQPISAGPSVTFTEVCRYRAGGPDRLVGRARLNHWRIAYASAKEVDTHLQLLVSAGAVNRSRAVEALRLFDRVRALTWGLLHPKR